MRRRRSGKSCALLIAAVVSAAGRLWAGINFDANSSTVTMTHDRDISADAVYTVNLGLGQRLGIVPRSATINPPTAPQLNNNFGSTDLNHSGSSAVASLGQVTNNTTASFTLGTGSGVSQNDPDHIYPGASSLLYNVDLWWTVPAATQFGPLANGFATIAMGGTVGAGSSASLAINLNFKDAGGANLRTPWLVNKTWLGGAGGATIAETFSTAKVLGTGSLAAGTKLRITGTVQFLAANDGEPVSIKPLRAEMGGSPPTGVFRRDPIGGGNWSDAASWQQPTDVSETNILTSPSGIGYRALFNGTTGGSAAAIRTDTPITLGTLDVDNSNDLSFVGNFIFDTQPGAGNAVMNVRGVRGLSGVLGQIVLHDSLDVISEGTSVTLNGVISGTGGITKLGPGPVTLVSNNTYSGGTTVAEGTLLVTTAPGGSATGSGNVTVQSGATLGGAGSISGAVNVAAGGIVDPGSTGIGALTVGGLTLSSGAKINLRGSGGVIDRIDVSNTNALLLSGPTVITLKESAAMVATDYVIIDYNGAALSSISNLSLASPALGRNIATLVHDTTNTDAILRLTAGPQWNVDANGSWATATNWTPAAIPGVVANFLGTITAPRTISLNGDRTAHGVNFDNASAYTIAPGTAGSRLFIADPTHVGNIDVASGAHTILAPVVFNGGALIDVANAAALSLSGGITIAAGKTVVKDGIGVLTIGGPAMAANSGTLEVANGRLNLNVNAGANMALAISGGTSGIVLGADQDLAELSVDFAAAGLQSLDLNSDTGPGAYRRVLVSSANLDATKKAIWDAVVNASDGSQDGIFDFHLHPNSRVGVAKITTLNAVLVRQTRIGDLNLDGAVTIADFIQLASHFNQAGMSWQEGDMNYDNSVTIADFIALASNFNQSYAGESWEISAADQQMLDTFAAWHGAGVPEPASVLALLGLVFLSRTRHGRNGYGTRR